MGGTTLDCLYPMLRQCKRLGSEDSGQFPHLHIRHPSHTSGLILCCTPYESVSKLLGWERTMHHRNGIHRGLSSIQPDEVLALKVRLDSPWNCIRMSPVPMSFVREEMLEDCPRSNTYRHPLWQTNRSRFDGARKQRARLTTTFVWDDRILEWCSGSERSAVHDQLDARSFRERFLKIRWWNNIDRSVVPTFDWPLLLESGSFLGLSGSDSRSEEAAVGVECRAMDWIERGWKLIWVREPGNRTRAFVDVPIDSLLSCSFGLDEDEKNSVMYKSTPFLFWISDAFQIITNLLFLSPGWTERYLLSFASMMSQWLIILSIFESRVS